MEEVRARWKLVREMQFGNNTRVMSWLCWLCDGKALDAEEE